MATAELDLAGAAQTAEAEYRALVARAARGDATLLEIRECLILSGKTMSTFERHTGRMRSRLEALENLAEAHRLGQSIKAADDDVQAAGAALAKARAKAAAILAAPTASLEAAQQRRVELDGQRTQLHGQANRVLGMTSDPTVAPRIGVLQDERTNLEKRAKNAEAQWIRAKEKLERLQARLKSLSEVGPGEPFAYANRAAVKRNIETLKPRVKAMAEMRDIAARECEEGAAEITAEIARLEASRNQAEAMDWS